MVTNYRIDYKYNEAVVNGAPLTGLAIAVSVDGVVSRHLSKPEGKWYVITSANYNVGCLGQLRFGKLQSIPKLNSYKIKCSQNQSLF